MSKGGDTTPTVPDSDTTSGTFFGSIKQRRFSLQNLSRRRKIVVLVSGVVLVAAILVWVFFVRGNNETGARLTAEDQRYLETTRNIEKTVQQAQAAQNPKDIASQLEQKANTAQDKTESVAFMGAAVSSLIDANSFDEALATALRFESKGPTAYTAELIARSYNAKGDFKKAAEYYGIAASRSEKTGPNQDSPYNQYLYEQKLAGEKVK